MLEKYNIELKNYMEECVGNLLGPVLDNINGCKCQSCLSDVTAIALNSLPPKYVVTKKGQLFTKIGNLQQQYDVDIIAAITKASVIVSRNPRHDEE